MRAEPHDGTLGPDLAMARSGPRVRDPDPDRPRVNVWGGCATLIHLFWRHRKDRTGCCTSPWQVGRGAHQDGCVGGVRNPDSSFLATPNGLDQVLHPHPWRERLMPKSGGGAFKLFIFFCDTEGSRPGVASPPKEKWRAIVWVGCATLIHLFWRHRKVGTGCCISPSKAARGGSTT